MRSMKQSLLKSLPYAGTILVFLLIAVLYFMPEISQGKVVFQGDLQQGLAMNHEGNLYLKQTGEQPRWTNSQFSGMPNYQMAPAYGPSLLLSRQIYSIYHLFLPAPASYVFIMMVGFFLLMLAFKSKWYVAAIGAIAYAFSSYFFIIIEAGHIWKLLTMAFIPPTIAGIVWAYRGKYWLGGSVAAFFAAMQLASNHVQMTYYSLFLIAGLVIAYLVMAVRQHTMMKFWKGTGVLVLAALLAVGVNSANLYHTYTYTKNSIRGATELVDPNANAGSEKGLEKEYITQWSYGKGESWSLMIPNVKGGGTGYLGKEEKAMKDVPRDVRQYVGQMNRYWGDQPFTSGPVYVGAFIVMLFLLGCFIVKGPIKWALLSVTLLTLILSWGKNLMWFTDLFIDYFPMYDKFRAVSSILVIPEICMPILAMLALGKIVQSPGEVWKEKKALIASFGLTGGVCLVFALFPTLFFNFLSQMEVENYLPQVSQNPELGNVLNALEDARKALFTADAWRSFFLIFAGTAALLLFELKKINKWIFITFVGVLVLGDMYAVNKRYLNGEDFQNPKNEGNIFAKTPADVTILQDPDPHYRVLNTTTDTYNEAITSYYHKSIGGNHGAKLARYRDLIERHLTKGNLEAINMLNTKYVIGMGEGNVPQAFINREANGNAWFVDSLIWVSNPNAEIDALGVLKTKTTAVADERFKSLAKPFSAADSTDVIVLTEYKPNELVYKSKTNGDKLAVFSEIYYPEGWTVTIDGKPAKEFRVNYVLRALPVPAGDHTIIFTFKPQSVAVTETIGYLSLGLIVLMAVMALVMSERNRKKEI